ncbi:hypothetical protein M413DRAFT_437740 [Hebeloma cylindrosporum]|uniref:Uncharacterized protein n=1 Tax=Hebeloma cylindrosporum TaxID=76867 RepID=A0A0C3CWI9_HEBCY|nr:hypothetical protein M413DRAFT_437740 [Hebeloma cylindrosporum h7]
MVHQGATAASREPVSRKDAERCAIGALPAELLILIFIFAQPTGRSRRRLRHKAPFEVIPTQVSRRWRRVALAIPQLWNRIDIYSHRSMHWARAYLTRSDGPGTLLDIYVDIYEWEKSRNKKRKSKLPTRRRSVTDVLKGLAILILPQLQRIRGFSIICFSEATCMAILHAILRYVSAPNLRWLRIKFDHFISSMIRRPRGFKILENGSQQLTFLEMDQGDCMPTRSSLRSLTSLHLKNLHGDLHLTYSNIVDILTAPDCLVYLSVEGGISMATWPLHHDRPDFHLRHLKAFRIYNEGTMALSLLMSMSAPQLESLWLDTFTSNFGLLLLSARVSQGLRRRGFPALRYLTLPTMNVSIYTELANIFTTITHLHLPRVDSLQFEMLKPAFRQSWSSLNTLVITSTRDEEMTKMNAFLSNILPERQRQGHPIENLLVEPDHLRIIDKTAAHLRRETKVEIVSVDSYQEPWWIHGKRLTEEI